MLVGLASGNTQGAWRDVGAQKWEIRCVRAPGLPFEPLAVGAQPAARKRPVEFHLYEQGGHGFGMYPKETTSTGWFDAFVRWMGMHGMLKPAK